MYAAENNTLFNFKCSGIKLILWTSPKIFGSFTWLATHLTPSLSQSIEKPNQIKTKGKDPTGVGWSLLESLGGPHFAS
jgi:hypothetical protein